MDVYKVGISLVLNNSVTPGLTAITAQLIGANNAVVLLNNNLARLKLAAAGAVAILGGVAIFEGFKKLVGHGKDVNDQLERMKQAGMSFKEIQDAMAQAQQTSSKVMTTTYSENLKHLLELRYAFGDIGSAMHHLDEVAKANSVLNVMKGGGKDQVWEFVKSLEGKGLTADPAAFSSYLNTMTKVVQATGGKVDPAMFFNTFKYGRTATQLWDESFVGGALPRLIQEMSSGGGGGGAGGPGNALMTGFAKLVQGQMSKASGEELEFLKLGSAKGIKGSGGAMTNVPSGSQFAKDPYEWTQNVLGPALKGAGIDMTDTVKVAQHVQKLFGVRTVADAVTKMLLQGRFMGGPDAPFEKDIRLNKQGLGAQGGFASADEGHYNTAVKEFHAQWKRLLETLAGPAMPIATSMIKTLANGLEAMGRFASVHPEGIKIALEALAALGAGLFVAGLVALGTAIVGLLGTVGILAGLAAAFVALAAVNWPSIQATFIQIGPKILEALKSAAAIVIGGIPGIFAGIGVAIANAIKGAVGGAISGIGRGGGGAAPTDALGNSTGASPMRYRPPPSRADRPIQANLIVDGQKLGKVSAKYMSRSMAGATEGSVYPDSTRMSTRNDNSYPI